MKKLQKGFTIIEVALVLAVGALIFLVVFLAVPALQRNQQNDARKRDQSQVVEAITSYISNNPTESIIHSKGDIYVVGKELKNKMSAYIGNLSTSTESVKVVDNDVSIASSHEDQLNQKKTIYVVAGHTCKRNNKDIERGAVRQAAVLAFVETATGLDKVCVTAN